MLSAGDPVELLGGALIVSEPQGAWHFTAIRATAEALRAAFGTGWEVRTQGPLALDPESEPEPDVAVVPGSYRDYRDLHPARPALVVEITESSLALDRLHKGSLYARAAVADYWIVNLIDRVLEVYRQPMPDPSAPFGWRYDRLERLDAMAMVTPLAVPAIRIRVADLLP
jgi:Uma2 family endonuclease